MRRDTILSINENQKLSISTYGDLESFNGNAVIYVHGFKGFKDWGFVPYLGSYLEKHGYFVITFNFSHNGIGKNPLEFTENEKFAKNTFSREIDELNYLIDSTASGLLGNYSFNSISLLGHSRGGGIALCTAVNNPHINSIALWASISKFDRYSDRQKKQWKEKGFFEVVNSRTGQVMKLNYSLIEDLLKNGKNKLNIEKAVSNLNKPLLIIHGNQDLAVPIFEGKTLYNWSDKSLTEFLEISATGHTFDAVHPFVKSNEKLDAVLNKTLAFYNKQL